MTFNLQGKELRLYPMDRASCLVNPDLTLKYLAEKTAAVRHPGLSVGRTGNGRSMKRIVFSTRSELSTAESKIREMLQLDIAINSENILMQQFPGPHQRPIQAALDRHRQFSRFSSAPAKATRAKSIFPTVPSTC